MTLFQRLKPKRLPSMKQVRRAGLTAALPVLLLSAVILLSGTGESLVSQGPMQAGHAEVACAQCHLPAPGTLRQQMQLNLRYSLGLAADHADFGYAKVSSEACLTCHQRPNERHPIYRFREPRFQKAVSEIDATTCLGCHGEHQDERVAVAPVFCQSCHQDLDLKVDPLDVPHDRLIANKDWESCMGCHDFHGNHKAKPPTKRLEAHELDALLIYLKNGPNPYSETKLYQAVMK